MAKTPQDKVYKEVKEYEPVLKYEKANSTSVYRVRLVEADTDPKFRVDLREHISSAKYTGFTGRGITLTPDQIDSVIKSLTAAKADYKTLAVKQGKKKKSK